MRPPSDPPLRRARESEVPKIDFREGSKRSLKLKLALVLGNALVAAVILGGPYYRGKLREEESRHRFSELCACLWDAEASPGGLTLPADDLGAYARAATSDSWPRDCIPVLDGLVSEETFWLWPDTRIREAEVRRAVTQVREELEAVESPLTLATRIPARPRLAILRLAAALGELAREVAAGDIVERSAIRLREVTPIPTRVPLNAVGATRGWMRPTSAGMETLVIDDVGIGWVRTGEGRVDARRLRRPGAVRGCGQSATPHLVWFTRDERCGAECSTRSMGITRLDNNVVQIPTPTWFRSHPLRYGNATSCRDDTVWVEGDSVFTLARTSGTPDGPMGAALRRFTWPSDEPPLSDESGSEEETPRLTEASSEFRLGEVRDAAFSEGTLRWIEVSGNVRRCVLRQSEGDIACEGEAIAENVEEDRVQGRGSWTLLSNSITHRTRLLHDSSTVFESNWSTNIFEVESGVRSRALLAGRDGDTTHVVVCAEDSCTTTEFQDSEYIAGAWLGETALLASAAGAQAPIVLRRFDSEWSTAERPGTCMDVDAATNQQEGLCGPPWMSVLEENGESRVIIGAREVADFRAVESSDGAHFVPARGTRSTRE